LKRPTAVASAVSTASRFSDLGMPSTFRSDLWAQALGDSQSPTPQQSQSPTVKTGYDKVRGAWIQVLGQPMQFTNDIHSDGDGNLVGVFGEAEVAIDNFTIAKVESLMKKKDLAVKKRPAAAGNSKGKLFCGQRGSNEVTVKITTERINGVNKTGKLARIYVDGSTKASVPLRTEELAKQCTDLAIAMARKLCAGKFQDTDELKAATKAASLKLF
jgi:hypothetical protein